MGDELELARDKTAMVLRAFERDLGLLAEKHVASLEDIAPGKVKEISTSENEKGRSVDSVAGLIQATYLGDIVDIVISATDDSRLSNDLITIRDLIISLDMYEVRNAIAHPNRPFHLSFWYKTAYLASCKAVQACELMKTSEALVKAELGVIELPEEHWLAATRWSIPNNLPSSLEHDITTLIGRNKEVTQLKKYVTSRKYPFIAITGPGGIGKTAICLEVLKDISIEPSASEQIDEILYFSLKTEELTLDGISSTGNTLTTIEQIKLQITTELAADASSPDSFTECCDKHRDTKLLLCLDNLDTLLRDHDQEFLDFYNELPADWKVIVTSRITVNSSTSIPIGALTDASALAFAKTLTSQANLDNDLKENQQIAEKSQCNPLAIKLLVANLVVGTGFNDALAKTSSDILGYSYKNIVDTLSSNCRSLIEMMFASDKPSSKSEMTAFLEFSMDEVSSHVKQLLETGLITRNLLDETYSLNQSIRELVLQFPLDPTIRDRYKTFRASSRQTISSRKSDNSQSRLNLSYIPNGLPDHLHSFLQNSIKSLLRSRTSHLELVTLKNEIESMLDSNEKSPILHRCLGLALYSLNDLGSAEKQFLNAAKLGDEPSCLKLATEYRDSQRLEEAKQILTPLIDNNIIESPDGYKDKLSLFCYEYFTTLNWLYQCEQVLIETENWSSHEMDDVASTTGVAHLDALRRLVELTTTVNDWPPVQDPKNRDLKYLYFEMLGTLKELTSRFGLTRHINKMFMKCLIDFEHNLRRIDVIKIQSELQALYDYFKPLLEECILESAAVGKGTHLIPQLNSSLQTLGESIGITPDAIATTTEYTEYLDKGYIAVNVSRIPQLEIGFTTPAFLIAEDKQTKHMHFVHRTAFDGLLIPKSLTIDSKFLIMPDASESDRDLGRYPSAKHAILHER